MAQFEEVLDRVRLALTWAPPAKIQALLEGLVEERIISEGYSKSLSLHQLGVPACEPKSGLMDSPGATSHQNLNRGQISQVWHESASVGHNHTRSEPGGHDGGRSAAKLDPPVVDRRYMNDGLFSTLTMSSLGPDEEMVEQMRERSADSMQKSVSDNERMNVGISEDEKEWLEQVEEAARRIAVPLWQQWDRGRSRLLPLVHGVTTGCAATDNMTAGSEAQRLVLNMEEETELEFACRTLDTDSFYSNEAEIDLPSFSLETERATDALKGLDFPTLDCGLAAGLDTDHFDNADPPRTASPDGSYAVRDANNNITDGLEDHYDVCWAAGGTTDTTVDPLCLQECASTGYKEDIALLFSSCTQKDNQGNAQDDSFYTHTDQSMTLSLLDHIESVFRTSYSTKTCSTADESEGGKESDSSHWGGKMLEEDQDPLICADFRDLPDCATRVMQGLEGVRDEMEAELKLGKLEDLEEEDLLDLGLPDDLSEYLKEDSLGLSTIDPDVLFSDPFWCSVDEQRNSCDAPVPAEVPCTDHEPRQVDDLRSKSNTRRKRPGVPRPQKCLDESTPSRPKRQRTAGRQKTKEAQPEPAVNQGVDSEPSPAEMVGHTTTPPRIVHLHPPIQYIIPESQGFQVVQTLRLSPQLFLPGTAAAPTFILVPASSPPCKRQVPPLSPVDGAVAPVQMSSSPPGSLSDTASRAMSPPCASPLSPSSEISSCKESVVPQSPTAPDIPQGVKDYIQAARTHISQTCQDMEPDLTLASHYVNVKVSQREILRSGKNTNKLLDKELIIMGDTDRQKSLLDHSQIFEGSNGDKPRRYVLLLGNAGMGKTTFIKKLCLDWSRDCIPQFDFVFLLDGKALTLTEPTFSLQTLLLNLSSSSPPCLDPEGVFAQILAAPKRVLVIFDGFDELRDYEILLQTQEKDLIASLQRDSKAQSYTVRQLYSAVLQRNLLPGCTLLLSARPRGTASQILRRTDSFLEVCGFTPTDIETYLSQYFTDPALRDSALDRLKNCSYLHLLCWNPGLCRLVCLVLEQCKSLEALPRTLTGLCHQVLGLKLEKDRESTLHPQAELPTQISVQSVEETQTQTKTSKSSQVKRFNKHAQTKPRTQVRTRTQRARSAKKQEKEEVEVDEEEVESVDGEADRREEKELLAQLGSLAWEGVKSNSSILPTGRTISAKLRAFGHRTGLFSSHNLRAKQVIARDETNGGRREERHESGSIGITDTSAGVNDDHILLWANPFLQSYLAGVHLCLSRTVSDRTFLQTLPFQSGPRGRRRPQREELELTQRFTVGLLFHSRKELQRLHSHTAAAFRDMVIGRQALVTKHLEGLCHSDLTPAQVLEACHYVYELSSTHGDGGGNSGGAQFVAHLAENLPDVLTFHGVPLNPADVFAVQNVLKEAESEGRSFSLDLEDSGIQISGLKALVGLNNINTYRACIADVITLWEQLEQSGEEELRKGAVFKFKIHPLKATQVCHMEHLTKLVNIHVHKRLSDSSSKSDSILAEGVPAVKELHKLEFELGPEKGPLALPMLWDLLPGLHNLQHLDLENCKISDEGAEKLAAALVSLCFLEILNLSQNCIRDQGVKKLVTTLRNLPKLHCLSLYSNVISDEGAESLAAVLPHMASLTDLDVKYNKLTDVGVQSLAVSLRNCTKMKTLRMWNQCIPYGVFERLQQQDGRILWH